MTEILVQESAAQFLALPVPGINLGTSRITNKSFNRHGSLLGLLHLLAPEFYKFHHHFILGGMEIGDRTRRHSSQQHVSVVK